VEQQQNKGACLQAMQQENAFFDDELRLTEDEYDLLLDCNYDDDLGSLGAAHQFCDSPTMNMILGGSGNQAAEMFVAEVSDMCAAKKSRNLQLQAPTLLRQESDSTLALDEPMLPSPSYAHHGAVPVMSQLSVDPSHFFNMTPHLQSLCNLDPVYRTQSGPAALGGAHQGCGHLSMGTHCASCTSLAFEPFGFPTNPPALVNPNYQQQYFQQQQQGGFVQQQAYQPHAYRSSHSDSVNTSSATSRRQSFDFQDQQQPSSSLLTSEWTFSSGTTSHSTSGSNSGSSTFHPTPSSALSHGPSLRCVSEDMESVAHQLTSKFVITTGSNPEDTTISHAAAGPALGTGQQLQQQCAFQWQ
jgi:hypothetical protein